MSNPMSGDRSSFDKAKEAASGLKDKLSGKGRRPEGERKLPGEDVPEAPDEMQDPEQQFPQQ